VGGASGRDSNERRCNGEEMNGKAFHDILLIRANEIPRPACSSRLR
jgi:hypothetical protein